MLASIFFAGSVMANDTGAWYDPELNGQGITIVDTPDGQVFWWFAHHPEFGQTWFVSSVETSGDFVIYRPLSTHFPVGSDFAAGDPVGTVELTDLADGGKLMQWDLLVEAETCGSLYGPVPPGPLDPRCKNEDDRFTPDRVLREAIDEQGQATLIRLTPEIQ